MIKRLVLIVLVFLMAGFALPQVSSSLDSKVLLANGNTLVRLRASFNGLWPTFPSTQFFRFVVSDESGFETSYYVPSDGLNRIVLLEAIFPAGSYHFYTEAYAAYDGDVDMAPGGYPDNVAVFSVDNQIIGVPTLNIPPPIMSVEVVSSDITLDFEYSLDLIAPVGGTSFSYEVDDIYEGVTTRYVTSQNKLSLTGMPEGLHQFRARVLVNLEGGGFGYSPYNTPWAVEVVPSSELLAPWYANIPGQWSTVFMLTFSTPGVQTDLFITSYTYRTIGGVEVIIRSEYDIPVYTTPYPMFIDASDIVDGQSGFMEFKVEGTECSGSTMVMMDGVTFDVTPMVGLRSLETSYLIPGNVSGEFHEFSVTPSYVLVNPGDEPATVNVSFRFAGGSCPVNGKTVNLPPVVVNPHGYYAIGYSHQYLQSLVGSYCPGFKFSIKVDSTVPVAMLNAAYDMGGGFGFWNN